jgi:integrase
MVDRTKYMSDQELAQLRQTTRDQGSPVEWLLVDLATQTGLRVSELASLHPGAFDLERSILRVARSKKRPTPGVPQKLAVLDMPATLVAHVREYLASNPKDFWHGERGTLGKRGLQYTWHRCCRRAGIVWQNPVGNGKVYGCSIHSARHTMAVRMLRVSGNLRKVQKQLGHSNPTTTANMYADVTHEDMLETLDKLS